MIKFDPTDLSCWMIRTMNLVIVLAFVPAFFSCKSTELIGSWKKADVEAKSYENIGVVLLSPKVSNKAMIETEVASALREKGIKAKATFDIFPFAGKRELIEEMDLDKDKLRDYVRKRVNRFSFDGLLIISLLDEQQESRYNQGSSFSFAYPAYGYNYYGYYSDIYYSVYTPGYYTTKSTYFVESNFYDVATENLIWTGQTKTKDPSSISKEAKIFAEMIVKEILNKNALVL